MKKNLTDFLFGSSTGTNKVFNMAWLLFRLHTGLSIAIHAGWPKMSSIAAPGWFTEQVAGLGFTFPSPEFWAAAASWGEFVGGLLIALGLLTRFAAVQLSFQFFVIAFLWYDQPEPLTGMYFQHLYFWCYLLLSVGGAGRYSIDALIIKRKTVKLPFKPVMAAAIFLLSIINNVKAQPVSVSIDELAGIKGEWKGSLNYLDYSSNKEVTLKAILFVNTDSKMLSFVFDFPDEPGHKQREKYRVRKAGFINNRKLIKMEKNTDSSLLIVMEEQGRDGNEHKPALFRHTWKISKNNFTIFKEVKFTGELSFIRRNMYSFSR